MRHLPALALAALLPGAAPAQTPAEAAATNFATAADLCLRNYHDAAGFLLAFREAGFDLRPYPGGDTMEFSAYGVFGYLTPKEFDNGCTIQSELVPFAMTSAIAEATAMRIFGDTVETGHPENLPTPCPMWSIFAPRRMIVVEVTSAGNGGGCDDPATGGMVVR